LPNARSRRCGEGARGLARGRRPAQNAALHRGWRLDRTADRHGEPRRRDHLRTAFVALICDTGPLYAGMDRADADHELCAALLPGSREQLVVPAPVIVELDWLAGNRLGPGPFLAFLADLAEGAIAVVDLVRADYVRVRELLLRYTDLRLGFVDAAIVAVV